MKAIKIQEKLANIDIYSNESVIGKSMFGENFTKVELINEKLDKLPKEVWSNPGLKWLDPCAGIGNYPSQIVLRLMKGLSKWEKNEEKRLKHILEQMVYMVEIQKSSYDKIQEFFNPNKEYSLLLINNDFIEIDLLSKFKVDSFDIIVGNPPYEKLVNDKRSSKNHSLWDPFTRKAFNLLKQGGYLLFITPPAWMSPCSKLLKDIFINNQILYLNVEKCSKYFKVGSKFAYYLLEKTPVYKKTIFDYSFKGGVYINSASGISEYKLNKNFKFLPQVLNKEVFGILEKTVFADNLKFDVRSDSDLHKFTKKELLSTENDEEHPYKLYHTPGQIVFSSRPHKTQEHYKLFIPFTTYYEKMFVAKGGNTQSIGYILVKNKKQGDIYKNILSKKMYRFLANITRWSNFNLLETLKLFPVPEIKEKITDEEIYNTFSLTEKEIAFIEKMVKNY